MQGKMKEKRQETCVDDDGEGETSGEAASSTVKSTIISSPSPVPSPFVTGRDGNKTRHSAGVQSIHNPADHHPESGCLHVHGPQFVGNAVDVSGCISFLPHLTLRSGVKLLCLAALRCRFASLWARAQRPRSGN